MAEVSTVEHWDRILEVIWADMRANLAEGLPAFAPRTGNPKIPLALISHPQESKMPDISLRITRQDDGQFVVERNGQSPEKIGKDWSVTASQIDAVFGQYMEAERHAENTTPVAKHTKTK